MPNEINPAARLWGLLGIICFLVGYTGMADARISTASITAAFGLRFIPLHSARYDLIILKEYLEQLLVQQFITILGHLENI